MKKTLSLLVAILICTLLTTAAAADELSDVQKKIDQKNSEYSNTLSNLDKIKKNVASLGSSVAGTQSELSSANEQLAQAKKQLEAIEATLAKKEKTLNYLIETRNEQIRAIYIHPQLSNLELLISSQNLSGFQQLEMYQNRVVSDSTDLIKEVNNEVVVFQKTRDEAAKVKGDLDAAVAAIQNRLNAQKSSLNVARSQQSSLSGSLDLIKSDITRALIRKAELDEQRRAGNFSGAPPVPIVPGGTGTTYYFIYGIGRYAYMGHGIGMSQWGAYGYAKNHGWNAGQILTKYYTGAAVVGYTQPPTIRVISNCSGGGGEQTIDFNTYLKGISELLSAWESDPSLIELSKAQVIAARTYAIRQVQGKGYVYGDTRDQCWTGNTGRPYWNQAVDATVGQVLSAGGVLANTLYSASHGGHSENNENVFQGWTGGGYQGYPVSYLRGVSDADSGGIGPYDNWGWNTKYSYTIGQVREILRRQGLTATENSWIDSRVGTLTGLGIERGVSGRVAWVVLYGSAGSAKIPGMVFRASFNSFPADGSPPANADDVMYSVNFSIGTQIQ